MTKNGLPPVLRMIAAPRVAQSDALEPVVSAMSCVTCSEDSGPSWISWAPPPAVRRGYAGGGLDLVIAISADQQEAKRSAVAQNPLA